MDPSDSLNEIADRDEPSGTDNNSDNGGSGASLPIPSVSKQQALILAAIAVVLVGLYMHRSGSSTSGADATEAVKESANEKREIEVSDGDTEAEIVLPENPDEVTELDAAILESDVFAVVGDGDGKR